MIDLYPAIEAIYTSHPRLREYGRILRPGTASKEHPPYTVLAAMMTDDRSTFGGNGTGLDVEVWELEFSVVTKTFLHEDAREWVEAMRDAFHNCKLVDPIFTSAGVRVIGHTGPENEDEQFKAGTTVEAIIQRDVLIPRTRY